MHESRVAIIIFSEFYANSLNCLQELGQILECFNKKGRLIYPVLYGDVERFIGKRVLSQAADLSGSHFLPGITNVHECIRAIVERVTTWINENEEDDDDTILETNDFRLWEKTNKFIGSGAFGKVYVYRHRKTGDLRAVKELIIGSGENEESIPEIEFFRQLEDHPNIVKYYGHKKEGDVISIHMEYIQPGSLKTYILESEGGKLDEPLIQNFTAQILFGLVHLHSNRGVHRDLKPDNLLVDFKNIVKLVDFGFARLLEKSLGKHSERGTLGYAAPEVLYKKNYHSSHEALAAEIWSLGCVIIEMFSGREPWWPDSDSDFEQPPCIPEELCPEGKDFLSLCFKREPAKRPSARQLLEHPFVKAQADALKEISTRIDGVETC